MTYLHILEFLGAASTMTGAFLVSRNKENLMFFGFIGFLTANLLMFAFATGKGMLPLQIQMAFFFFGSLPGLKAYSSNWKMVRNTLFSIFMLYMILIISVMDFKISITDISPIEVIAATIAIVGSYMLRYKNSNIKIISFMMFFVADVLYVAISIELGLIFFGIQSLFFWYTSIDGIRNELNGESFILWMKNINLKIT